MSLGILCPHSINGYISKAICRITIHNLQNMRFLHGRDTINMNNEQFGLQNKVNQLTSMHKMIFLRIV